MKKKKELSIDDRRIKVADLMLEGHTGLQIYGILKKDYGINISIHSIKKDMLKIKETGIETFKEDKISQKAMHLQELRHLKKVSWIQKKYYLVLQCLEREAALLGLDEPISILNDYKVDIKVLTIDEQKSFIKMVNKMMDTQKRKIKQIN